MDWDEWFEIEHKGRRAGKIHLKSHWAPLKAEVQDHDEMSEIQNVIRELATKKRELQAAFNDIKDKQEEHKIENEAKLAAAEAGGADGEDWEAKAAESEAKCVADHEAAETMRGEAESNKAEFEKSIAEQIKIAAETRDTIVNGLESAVAEAEERKAGALAKAEEEKVACEEKNAGDRAAIEAEIEEEKRHDHIAHDKITDEIKEVAEKCLAINAQIQAHLEALTNL